MLTIRDLRDQLYFDGPVRIQQYDFELEDYSISRRFDTINELDTDDPVTDVPIKFLFANTETEGVYTEAVLVIELEGIG